MTGQRGFRLTTTKELARKSPLDRGPLIAHRISDDPLYALCGVRLIGVPARPGYPHICEECERIHGEGA